MGEITAEQFRALVECNPYRPCTCGISANHPSARERDAHDVNCDYRKSWRGSYDYEAVERSWDRGMA